MSCTAVASPTKANASPTPNSSRSAIAAATVVTKR